MQLLTKRLLRLWLILGLPAAALCLYAAYGKYKSMQFFKQSGEYWQQAYQQRQTTGVRGMLDPVVELGRAMHHHNDAATSFDLYVVSALVLATLPITFAVARALFRWIWVNPALTRTEPTQDPPRAFSLRSGLPRRLIAVGAVIALALGMLACYPDKTIGTLVSIGVQVLVIGVALWLVRRFRK